MAADKIRYQLKNHHCVSDTVKLTQEFNEIVIPMSNKAASITAAPFNMVAIKMS